MKKINHWVSEPCYKRSLYILAFSFFLLAIIFGCSGKKGSYQLGSIIFFGQKGTAEQYQTKGWSGPEAGFTWTDGNSAELLMRIDKAKSDLILTATLQTLTVPGKLEKQRVTININGKKAGEWVVKEGITVKDPGVYKLEIPQDYLKDPELKITFELPDATSPLELGFSKDPRKLGLALKTIELSGK